MKGISRWSTRCYSLGNSRGRNIVSMTIPYERITIQDVGCRTKPCHPADKNYTAFEKPAVLLGSDTDKTSDCRTSSDHSWTCPSCTNMVGMVRPKRIHCEIEFVHLDWGQTKSENKRKLHDHLSPSSLSATTVLIATYLHVPMAMHQ